MSTVQDKYDKEQGKLYFHLIELQKEITDVERQLALLNDEASRTKESIDFNQYNYEHGSFCWPSSVPEDTRGGSAPSVGDGSNPKKCLNLPTKRLLHTPNSCAQSDGDAKK